MISMDIKSYVREEKIKEMEVLLQILQSNVCNDIKKIAEENLVKILKELYE